jgi:beta-N-acetylhexosaminidase
MTLTADVAATLQPGFVGTVAPAWLERAHAAGLVSVCLYGDNVDTVGGLRPVCRDLHERMPGVLLATDEEGGDVTRLHYPAGSTAVGNGVLGRLDDSAATRDAAASIGRELVALGVRLDLAPSVDVNSSPDNPVIGVRSFGADPGLVSRHAVAWVEGLQSTGVAACAKHFPGHGDTVTDSHHALPHVTASLGVLRERELAPFRAVVEAGVATVMTSHIVLEALDAERPATFSPTVIGILREELGFDGVLVSDALDMAGASAETGIPEAAVRALAAGVDLLCLGSGTDEDRHTAVQNAVVEAVRSGRLPRARVAEAAARVRRLAERHAAPPPPDPTAVAVDTTSPELVARAFGVSDAGRRWLASAAPTVVVQVDTTANLAVGAVAWGPAALGVTEPEDGVPPGAKVAVVGRGVGPDHPARDTVVRLRERGHEVVLVECGWPRGDADLVTYGASPVVAAALLAVLHDEVTLP